MLYCRTKESLATAGDGTLDAHGVRAGAHRPAPGSTNLFGNEQGSAM